MPVTWRDIKSGRVDLSRLAERRGGWLGAQGPDPQDATDCPRCRDHGLPGGCPRCGS